VGVLPSYHVHPFGFIKAREKRERVELRGRRERKRGRGRTTVLLSRSSLGQRGEEEKGGESLKSNIR